MNQYKKMVAAAIAAHVPELDMREISTMIETPPEAHMGDYAFPCFRLAKTMRKSPQLIAEDISNKIICPDIFEKCMNEGAYVNFFFNRKKLAEEMIGQVLAEKESFGSSKEGNGKIICIDYSAPNIAKPFHVGHLRSTVIGNALYKIYSHLGYTCIGINHLGDWGTQFGKVIVAYRNWGDAKAIEKEPIQSLLDLYVKFHEEAEKNPSLEDEAREWFTRMEKGDEEALSLWKWFSTETIKELEKIYALLGVKFDYYTGESFYNDKMEPVLRDLADKNLLTESQGATMIDLEAFGMPPCLVQKSDGSTLYATRDITAAIYRKNTYDFFKCLYLTDYSQKLHFAQWFKVIELMGYEWHLDLLHLPFGRVTHEGRRIQTRKGTVVLLEEVLNGAIDRVKEIIEEKNPNLENKLETAVAVGVGAVIFNDLSNNRIKDISFSWETAFSFEGETGPYVQYTHARACSVLRKASEAAISQANHMEGQYLTDDISYEVIRKIEQFSDSIADAKNKNEPSILTRHVIDLAQAFNRFYHDHPVLNAEPEQRNARLALVAAVKETLSTGLSLLGIQAPEKM
ncbi:arginine--tRNA ligase [Anoxynatronum buryatiense]|uniref:Arginine--tRNA ligase n=1 Tax=Anoxynatronum buryatiense TaxID=489973 RepID=A0AA45WSF3_9CLOT|nr:arginine--tRNA ligase [Anoxynatronum buryatiense]SMP37697.1 arginyl-tRNA synthetase [Anoxynatronum buryatiense]